jgi:membrane protease YdiL (CAAX protease family)
LHLVPGVLILLFALAVAPLVIRMGLPLLLVPSLWVICVLIPVELGFLLYQGKRLTGTFSLRSVLRYRTPMPVRSYLLLIPPLVIWGILAFLVITPRADPYLSTRLFFWLPDWFFNLFTPGPADTHTRLIVVVAVVLNMITNPVAGMVEELYYRGYLLPRIAHLKGGAPLVSAVLFSLQHLFSPWQNPARIVALLPMVYAVSWKRNIFIGLIVHGALDLISAAAMLSLLFR